MFISNAETALECNKSQIAHIHVYDRYASRYASVVPLQTLQRLQHSFLRHACRVKKGVPIQIIFEELPVTRWHDFWWRRVVSFWNAIVVS